MTKPNVSAPFSSAAVTAPPERRAAPRIEREVRVTVRDGAGRAFFGCVRNVSATGLLLRTDRSTALMLDAERTGLTVTCVACVERGLKQRVALPVSVVRTLPDEDDFSADYLIGLKLEDGASLDPTALTPVMSVPADN